MASRAACSGPSTQTDTAATSIAPAPEFRLTTRHALHSDLTAVELAHELGAAARQRTPGERVGAVLATARALRAAGEDSTAGALELDLLRDYDRAPHSFLPTEIAPLVELAQRERGVVSALELAGRITDPTAQDRAMLGVLDRVRREDPKKLDHVTLVLLAPRFQERRNHDGLARLANLYLAVGDRQRSAECARLATECSRVAPDLFASADVLSTLVQGHLAVRDVAGARECVRQYSRTFSAEGLVAMEVGIQLTAILRQALEQGALADVRDLPSEIQSHSSRAEAHALIAMAEAEAGRTDAAREQWAEARKAARENGTPGLCDLAERLQSAGQSAEAAGCLEEARNAMQRAADAGQRTAWQRNIGRAEAALGRLDAALTIALELPREPAWVASMRNDLLADLAVDLWKHGHVARVLPTLDQLSTADARGRAIRDHAQEFAAVDRPERERAELVAGLVARARQLPLDLLTSALAAIVQSGLAVPRDPSALHPWSLPPCLPGGWKTPTRSDAEAYVRALEASVAADGLAKPAVRALRERALVCYPAGRVIELDGVVEGLPYVYTLLSAGSRTIRVGGTGTAWNALNVATPPRLDSDTALLEYARFYATQIGDNSSRCRVVGDAGELAELVRAGATLPALAIEAPRVLERRDGSASVQLTLAHQGGLQTARFEVGSNGKMTMHDERSLAGDLPLDREIFQERTTGGYLRVNAALTKALELLPKERGAGAFELARVYATGFGRGGWSIDEGRANGWLRTAEENERAHAYRDMGTALVRGEGVKADPQAALVWLRAAGDARDFEAGLLLARVLLATRSPRLVTEALDQLEYGVDGEHAESLLEFGLAAHNGTVVTSADPVSGRKLLLRAAARGSGAAALHLGLIAADAVNIPRDVAGALEHFQSAAKLGVPVAWYFLGILRANGHGPVELGTPEDLYRRAAEADVHAARVVLALRARERAAAEHRGVDGSALDHARIASTAGHRYGALAEAWILLDAGDVLAARVAYQRALSLGLPAPTLRSFVDPCYLEGQPAGVALDAAKRLDEWRASLESRLAARLTAK